MSLVEVGSANSFIFCVSICQATSSSTYLNAIVWVCSGTRLLMKRCCLTLDELAVRYSTSSKNARLDSRGGMAGAAGAFGQAEAHVQEYAVSPSSIYAGTHDEHEVLFSNEVDRTPRNSLIGSAVSPIEVDGSQVWFDLVEHTFWIDTTAKLRRELLRDRVACFALHCGWLPCNTVHRNTTSQPPPHSVM
ncbi:hypothetical protein LshimejAT787_0606410 [Lyophyllum shimeji]|uniref:Uncharacterized protein n=1 Tax=Lyophyllum shimeji TaxID=47721 RepID=A0A9P3PQ32_LYOSH|nr:hypothetical protein LshimejAT787_0606410 [Lyophyllum shimeji]